VTPITLEQYAGPYLASADFTLERRSSAIDLLAAVNAVLAMAEANGEWAIITLHRAVTSGAGSLETTADILAEVVAYGASRVADGNLVIEPLGRAYNRHFSS
jgi:hypothetical protein